MNDLRVVVATDGSLASDIARTVLSRLPLPKGTTFTVAMVSHAPIEVGVGLGPASDSLQEASLDDRFRFHREVSRRTVERVAEGLRNEGFEAESLVLEGDTASELLELISDQRARLTVVGCGINSNFAALFLGSVSRKLVLYSEASVLVGRAFSGGREEESCKVLSSKPKLDLLVPVDGSTGADIAVQSLERLKSPLFGNIYVLSVDPRLYMSSLEPALILTPDDSTMITTEAIAHSAAARIANAADHVVPLIATGRPSVEIERVAREKSVDLVVMGANRHGAFERFLLGSCAYESATSAPCSVLILRDVLPLEGQD